jgi:hypothetical protein
MSRKTSARLEHAQKVLRHTAALTSQSGMGSKGNPPKIQHAQERMLRGALGRYWSALLDDTNEED